MLIESIVGGDYAKCILAGSDKSFDRTNWDKSSYNSGAYGRGAWLNRCGVSIARAD